MTGEVTTSDCSVCHHHNRKIVHILFVGNIKQLLEQTFRHVSLVCIRNGNYIALSWHLNDQVFLLIGIYTTNRINLQRLPWCTENIMLRTAIMITRCDNNCHIRIGIMNLNQSVSKHRLYGCRWLRSMINITAEQEHIWLLLPDDIHHLKQHRHLLLRAIVIVKCVTKVPVTCMQYFHRVKMFFYVQLSQFKCKDRIG